MQYSGAVFVLLTKDNGTNTLVSIESVEDFGKRVGKKVGKKTEEAMGSTVTYCSGRTVDVKESPAEIDQAISDAKHRELKQTMKSFSESMMAFGKNMQDDIEGFMRDHNKPDGSDGPDGPDDKDRPTGPGGIGGPFGM
jgi:hypothetical protein